MRWPFRRAADRVSHKWLRELDRKGDRIEFHGVTIMWPIRKVFNESAVWNRAKDKRRA